MTIGSPKGILNPLESISQINIEHLSEFVWFKNPGIRTISAVDQASIGRRCPRRPGFRYSLSPSRDS